MQNFVGFIFVAILKREEARLSLFSELQQQQILLQKKLVFRNWFNLTNNKFALKPQNSLIATSN